jgi:hypothetical protein
MPMPGLEPVFYFDDAWSRPPEVAPQPSPDDPEPEGP